MTDSCRVDEPKRYASYVHGVFDHVARGAVNIAHDGFFFLEQQVEQRGFADVGLPDNGYRDAALDGITQLKRACQCINFLFNLDSKLV